MKISLPKLLLIFNVIAVNNLLISSFVKSVVFNSSIMFLIAIKDVIR